MFYFVLSIGLAFHFTYKFYCMLRAIVLNDFHRATTNNC